MRTLLSALLTGVTSVLAKHDILKTTLQQQLLGAQSFFLISLFMVLTISSLNGTGNVSAKT